MCYNPIIFQQYYDSLGNFHSHYFADYNPDIHSERSLQRLSLGLKLPGQYKHKFVVVPCGKCKQCRARLARDWKVRLYHHSLIHGTSLFITLTYNDEHMDDSNLNYRHFQLFMKKLRRRFPDRRLSFFCAGEYGGKSFRRHFHCLVFGLNINDVKSSFLCRSRKDKNIKIWRSDLISECWFDEESDSSRGYISVSQVLPGDPRCFGYVAGYIISKSDQFHSSIIESKGLSSEFHHMSLKPAIGKVYFLRNYEQMYRYNYCLFNGRKISIPRAYDRWYDKITSRLVVKSYSMPYNYSISKINRNLHCPSDPKVMVFLFADENISNHFCVDKISDFDKIKLRRRKIYSSFTCSQYNLDSQKINCQSFLCSGNRDLDLNMEVLQCHKKVY